MSEVISVTQAASPAIPLWLEFLRAVAPVVAASIAAFVAWRFGKTQTQISGKQAQTAAEKLRLDLFEKRLAVYETAKSFVNSIQANGNATPTDEREFLQGVAPANWLFDDEIRKYLLEDLWYLSVDLSLASTELRDSDHTQERNELAEAHSQLLRKVGEQRIQLIKIFKPYLHFPL